MSEYKASISWNRETEDFNYDTYDRNHRWQFEDSVEVLASAAPEYKGSENRVDPEQALVASLSSCHMLTFLALAARSRLVVDEYTDNAVGFMEKNNDGKLAITKVILSPKVLFAPESQVSLEKFEHLHKRAHEECFIANSVKTHVEVNPQSEDLA